MVIETVSTDNGTEEDINHSTNLTVHMDSVPLRWLSLVIYYL